MFQPWVYYFLGRRDGQPAIKIGVSGGPTRRLKEVKADRALAWHEGGYPVERRLHEQFAADAIPGHNEWFKPSVALLSHIGAVADGSELPDASQPAPRGAYGPSRCDGCDAGSDHVCF